MKKILALVLVFMFAFMLITSVSATEIDSSATEETTETSVGATLPETTEAAQIDPSPIMAALMILLPATTRASSSFFAVFCNRAIKGTE